MPRVRFTATIPIKINGRRFSEKSKEFIIECMRVAGKAFIETANPLVPVWTGMSRGSFLADVKVEGMRYSAKAFFNMPKVSISPMNNKPKTYYPTGQEKTPEYGAQISEYRIEQSQKGGKNKFSFVFHSPVLQYQMNEFEEYVGKWRRSASAPWKSIEQGMASFKAVMKEQLRKRQKPKVRDYTTYMFISAGDGHGIQMKTIQAREQGV